MPESDEDKISRLRAMIEPRQQTWDLSRNDIAAIRHALELIDSKESAGGNQGTFRGTAVKQTRPTNCFQACVATLLGIPIEDVPDACDGAQWDFDAFQDWLALRGLQAIEVTFGSGGTIYPVQKPVRCILTGESPRGQTEYSPGKLTSGLHAVVAELVGLEGFNLLYDPHPSEAWIGEPTHATFFVQIETHKPAEQSSELEILRRVDGVVQETKSLIESKFVDLVKEASLLAANLIGAEVYKMRIEAGEKRCAD